MKTMTIRGIDEDLDRAIKSRAEKTNLSANQWVLQALKMVTGTAKEPVFKTYQDLDALAGGWSEADAAAFRKNTQVFEQIDKDLWK